MTRLRTREWSSTDYYDVLGVSPAAPPSAIDTRYRELAKALHPDRNQDPGDQEQFKRVSTAYTALRDPATRAAYDDFRTRVATGTLPPVGRPPASERRSDPLAPPRRPRSRRPAPVWLRRGCAVVLIVLGCLSALWAAVGTLPAPTSADTPVAVQVTLLIMAVKLWAGGAIVARYPQLRARWHR